MNEVVVDNITYAGGDLSTHLENAMNDGETPEYLRLEVYLDQSNVREPYLIRAHVDLFSDQEWSWPILRCWPFKTETKFELWVTPVDAPDKKLYTDVDSKVGSNTVPLASPTEQSTIQLDSQFTLKYSVRDAPDATYLESVYPNTEESREVLERTRAIQSAIQDFDPDNEHPFLKKPEIRKAAKKLSNRSDLISDEGNSSDGFPDDAVRLADQDDRDYCAAAALLFAFSQKRPRRLVEFCRSVYDPIAIEADGSTRYGYLSRSVTMTFLMANVKKFYENQQSGNRGRTPYEAHVDVLILFIRALLVALPEIPRTETNQYRSALSGLTAFEERELLNEVIGIDGGSVFKNHPSYHRFPKVLDAMMQASSPDKVCMLSIDSSLVQSWKPRTASDLKSCPPTEGGGHTITILSMSKASDDTYTISYQNPWGGEYGGPMTVEKAVLEEMVTAVVVTGVQGGL